jgi:hypothetical protein
MAAFSPSRWDDDLPAGSIHLIETLEFFLALRQIEWTEPILLDQFPFREDPVEAARASIRTMRARYETSAASHDDDPNTQSQLIDTAISRKAKAIILDNAGAQLGGQEFAKAMDLHAFDDDTVIVA